MEPKYQESRADTWSEILTIMFIDLAGYTKRTTRLGRAEFNELHDVFDALSIPTIKQYKGWIIKKIGDAFLAAFRSPTDAVKCGISIQNRFMEYNKHCDQKDQLHVRVVLHTGEVLVKNGDVYGDAVNTAARIEGIAKADHIVFSGSTYLSMNKAEIPFIHLGTFRFKGLKEPVRLFRVKGPYKKIIIKKRWDLRIVYGLMAIAIILLVALFIISMMFPERVIAILKSIAGYY